MGWNLLHILGSAGVWHSEYTSIVEFIHRKQGNHHDAFLQAKDSRGRTPLDLAGNCSDHPSPKALLAILSIQKPRLAEIANIFPDFISLASPQLIRGSPLTKDLQAKGTTEARQVAHRVVNVIALRWFNFERRLDRYLMAAKNKLALEMLSDYASIQAFNLEWAHDLQNLLGELTNTTFNQAIEARNWPLLAALLAPLSDEERAIEVANLQLPENLGIIEPEEFIDLHEMGVFEDPTKNRGKNVAYRLVEVAGERLLDVSWEPMIQYLSDNQTLWVAESAPGENQWVSPFELLYSVRKRPLSAYGQGLVIR